QPDEILAPCRQRAARTAVYALATQRFQPQHPRQLRVIAEYRVSIQRQMVADDVQAMRQRKREPGLAGTDDPRILALPEPPVVDQNGIGVALDGSAQQCLGCGDTGNDAADGIAPFDLQAVGAIIAKTRRLQGGVQPCCKLGGGDTGPGCGLLRHLPLPLRLVPSCARSCWRSAGPPRTTRT